MNFDGMKRFEEICKKYIYGSDETRETILSFFNENDKETFLQGVSFYKLFTQADYYKAVSDTVAEKIYWKNN